MEVNNIRVEQAARVLIDGVKDDRQKKDEPIQEREQPIESTDIVDIEKENLLAANILPNSIKEASKLIREIKSQILANPEQAFDVQANINSPNIVGLL